MNGRDYLFKLEILSFVFEILLFFLKEVGLHETILVVLGGDEDFAKGVEPAAGDFGGDKLLLLENIFVLVDFEEMEAIGFDDDEVDGAFDGVDPLELEDGLEFFGLGEFEDGLLVLAGAEDVLGG